MEASMAQLLATARDAAVEAGRLLLSRLDGDFQVSKKGPIDLVTEMDLEAERIIISRIRESFPDHQILAEEKGSSQGSEDFRWIIDPLDGTTNYAHGYRFFSVSIALEVGGQIVLGVVYDPVTEELFSARHGEKGPG